MLSTPLFSMYRMVCNAPDCGGIAVEHMPELIESDAAMNYQPHTHMFYEILWFQDAGGSHFIDFQRYPIAANTLFFLSPGQVHHFDPSANPRGYSIKICTDFFEKSCEDSDLIRYGVFQASTGVPYAHISEETAEQIGVLIGQMQQEQASGDFGHQEMLRLLARILLIMLRRHIVRPGDSVQQESTPAYNIYIRFLRLLDENYTHLHLVSDYASRLQVSTKTLSNAVRITASTTPLALINDRLTMEAKRLLRFSNLMVKEIAYHLGFDDPSNFVKFFKHQTGYLPSDFQKAEQGAKG